jgi:hypothetical protein
MEQGRMSEAQRLMDALQEFLENMQVRQGEGQGAGGEPSDAAREQLEDTLREQQELSDDTFQKLQEQFGQEPSGTENEKSSETTQTLEERQQSLRSDLSEEGSSGTEDGGTLGAARQAMREAQDALSQEDYAGALDTQAQALEALREGLRELSEDQGGEAEGASRGGDASQNTRDPLGRNGEGGTSGLADSGALHEGLTPHNRAQDLSKDLQRRYSEQDREQAERDFLERLLKSF